MNCCVGGLVNKPACRRIAQLLPAVRTPPQMGQPGLSQEDVLRNSERFERMVAALSAKAGLPRGEAIRATRLLHGHLYWDWLRVVCAEAGATPAEAEASE